MLRGQCVGGNLLWRSSWAVVGLVMRTSSPQNHDQNPDQRALTVTVCSSPINVRGWRV